MAPLILSYDEYNSPTPYLVNVKLIRRRGRTSLRTIERVSIGNKDKDNDYNDKDKDNKDEDNNDDDNDDDNDDNVC